MSEKGINEDKDDERPNEPFGTIAIVVRMPLSGMPDLVRNVQEIRHAKVIYQRTSAGRLMIVEER